ncbi:hypothetical protein B0I37DRAFT_206388 [Chaetomium sp. MPI-CAGE-AT-0009]|nr:hypothetical protein B0I37DRAFT_206388 [Chaetomium sp. MPI-CAGE-AT-0009]
MEAAIAPRSLSDDFQIHEHTRGDIASPATAPLLRFLINFTKPKRNYHDALLSKPSHELWSIGNEALVPPSAELAPEKEEIPDESAQDEKTYMNIIDNGLPRVPAGTSVTIVGGGISGLVAGYELKRAGFDVRILEASSRVGGRVVTFRDPLFAPGLHGEGGAMRIPRNHFLLHAYIKKFKIDSLFDFEMKNKFIYLSDYKGGTTVTYDDFDKMLHNKDPELLAVFPGLKENEKGKTCDDLFLEAVTPVVELFKKAYDHGGGEKSDKIRRAYQTVTEKYDKYTLRSFLNEVAGWSDDAIRLYDLGNAHVVFENGFIESWKDAFLSSNTEGKEAGIQQLQHGMDQVPKAFLSTDRGEDSLDHNITYGARVTHLEDLPPHGDEGPKVRVDYETTAHNKYSITSDYVILTVPYTAQRAITKSRPFTLHLEQAIRDVRYIEVTKILLQYKERWWERVFTEHKQGTDGGLVSDLPIRYTMFPMTKDNTQTKNTKRGAIMAAYTFQQDATILSAMPEGRRVRTAAENLDRIFPDANTLKLLEGGASQAFPTDELAGGSAFCYFGPGQKSQYLETMCTPDWAYPEGSGSYRVFLAGEHASYTHGWIQGAMEAALRCARQVHEVVTSKPANKPVGKERDLGVEPLKG